MKIKCFYRADGEKILYSFANIENSDNYNINYSRYLLSYLIFSELSGIKFGLDSIEKIEKGEKEVLEGTVVIPDIYIYIYKEKTFFEHNYEDWEEWECPTIVVKKGLEGYKKFLEMPQKPDTTYEFEIDDSYL